jgi:hypothetical protein
VTVLLARNRQPPPTVAAGVPHAEFAAELVTLPSGLLAMVCEAIVKLKVRRGGVRAGRLHGRWERADEVPAYARRLLEYWGSARISGWSDRVRSAGSTPSSTGLVLFRFPMWPEPGGTPSVRALCAVVRD